MGSNIQSCTKQQVSTMHNEASPFMDSCFALPFKCMLGLYCTEARIVLNPKMSLIDVCYIRGEEFETVRTYLQKDKNQDLAVEQQVNYFSKVYHSFDTFNASSKISNSAMLPLNKTNLNSVKSGAEASNLSRDANYNSQGSKARQRVSKARLSYVDI
jgi:hypothetical protein